MNDLAWVEAVRIRRSEDVRPAAQAVRALAEQIGDWRVAVTSDISRRRPMLDDEGRLLATTVFGWTECDGWWRSPHLALESPIPMACRYEGDPFWCNTRGFYTLVPNPLLQALDIRDFLRRSHTHAAILVPVHMPFGMIGAASIIPRDKGKSDLAAEFEQSGEILGLAIRTFVTSYVRVMRPATRSFASALLNKREVECLRWAAGGKTDQEISLILSRSRGTVRFHIQNAQLKLDAVNRSQTIFKAAQLGYIGMVN